MIGRRLVAVLLTIAGSAAYLVLVDLHRDAKPSWDTYGQFVPYAIHAVRAVADGGKGLLWNPFNGSGVPFFANGVSGLLYPPHLLFLVFETNVALHLVLMLDIAIAGLGMWLLARQWGLSQPAALAAVLAIELGYPMTHFAAWNPMIAGTFAWTPWVLLACERLLLRPTAAGVAGLAAALAIQFLPGLLVMNALTYQILGCRVAWELLCRWRHPPWRAVAAVAAGMVLGPLLVAVQLLPFAEFAQQSSRVAVPVAERLHMMTLPFAQYVRVAALRRPDVPLLVVPIILALLALAPARTRLVSAFYFVLAVVSAVLALGPLTPLFELYLWFPPGLTVLNVPSRVFWVTGLMLCVLAPLGVEALVRAGGGRRLPLVAVLACAALASVAPGGLRRGEAIALGFLVVVLLLAVARRGRGVQLGWMAVAALAINLVAMPLRYPEGLVKNLDFYRTHAPVLEELAGPWRGAQERLYLIPNLRSELAGDFMRRTSTVLGLQNFSHYEALPARRQLEYELMLRAGTLGRTFADQFVAMFGLTEDYRPRLLDVAAIRYLVTPEKDATQRSGDPKDHEELVLVHSTDPALRIYRNDHALPRARFVGRLEVVPAPRELLERMANGGDDLADVAFVEETPPSGFTGFAANGRGGRARFAIDDPERLVIEVDAPARGFLLLADSFYPGWGAKVNGRATPVLRANYMFRAVEVPRGRSMVELRFFPTHLLLGAVLSGVAAIVLVGLLAYRRLVAVP